MVALNQKNVRIIILERMTLMEQLELNQEQIERVIDCIVKLANTLIDVVIKVTHQIVEYLTKPINIYKRVRKGKRYILKSVLRVPLIMLFTRRC